MLALTYHSSEYGRSLGWVHRPRGLVGQIGEFLLDNCLREELQQ